MHLAPTHRETCLPGKALEVVKFYIAGSFSASISGIIYYVTQRPLSYLPYVRFSSIGSDPNFYGVSIALAISLCLIVYMLEKKKSYLVLVAFFFLFGILTQSKGFLVANTLNALVFLRIFFRFRLKEMLTLLVLVTVLVFSVSGGQLIERTFLQFSQRFSNIDSGRFEIWAAYLKLLTESPKNMLFGLGGFERDLFLGKYALTHMTHNLLIGALAEKGLLIVLNLTLVMLFLGDYLRKQFAIRRVRRLFLVPFGSVILGYLFLDAFTQNILYFSFYLALLLSSMFEDPYRNVGSEEAFHSA